MPKDQSVILVDTLIRVTSAVASLAPPSMAGSPGFNTVDLKEAKALLGELS